MVPDLDLQLQVAIKALTDTVAPALDPAQRVAHEQLGLAIATLSMVREHLPLEQSREWKALADARDLAEAVHAHAPGTDISAAIAEAQGLLAAGNPAPGARKAATARLLAAVSAVARAPETPRPVLALIVDKSGPSTDLARAWCLAAGFEPDPAEVPALARLLSLSA
jgi:hypothetical protein